MANLELAGTVSLVTGATGGIGRETVKALAAAGSAVIATDLANEDHVEGALVYHSLDVSDEDGWLSLIARIEAEHGRLDNLVNSAGIAVTNSIAATSLAEWRKSQAVNVEGTFLGTKSAADLLRRSGADRRGGSSIVNLSSVAGLKGTAYMATYSTTKGAVRLFTKCAATEYAALNWPIRVNSVHPGAIDTRMMDGIFARYAEEGLFPDKQAARDASTARHANGRLGTPDEIAAGIVFLCSPAASFMTGSELVIDGGLSAR